MNNLVFSFLGAIMFLIVGYFALQGYLQKETDVRALPERVHLQGTYLCLPVREGFEDSGDCAVGMRTDDGAFYAVDFGLMSQIPPQLIAGDRFSANGVRTPIETLSTNYWDAYEAVAIFSVTDSVELIASESENVDDVSSEISTTTQTQLALEPYGTWVWQHTELQTGEKTTPHQTGAFVLILKEDGTYTSTTDCNSLGGSFVYDAEIITFSPPISTKMYCADSQESEYVSQLASVTSHVVEGTTLYLNFYRGSGAMVFLQSN